MNALFVLLTALAVTQDPVIPAPRGLVNDFAGVIDAATAARIEQIASYVRARSGGEIAVVTMRDIGGREVNDVALRIGREWGVGSKAAIGERARNAGVVILVIPKETASDRRGQVAVEVGQGAEGFIPDGVAGDIWRAAIPDLRRADYSAAIERITLGVAERYAREFDFTMDSIAAQMPQRRAERRGSPVQSAVMIGVIILIFALSFASRGGRGGRGRRRGGLGGALPWIVASALQNRGGSRSRGGGWGGSGGGGFGGFGGGGGFSGGGSHGSW